MLFNVGKAFLGLTAAFSHGKAKIHPGPPVFFADNSGLETPDTKPAKIVQTCSKSQTEMNGSPRNGKGQKPLTNFVSRAFL